MQLLLSLTLVLAAGVIAQVLSERSRIPSIVFLLAAGIILGPEGVGILYPDKFGVGQEVIVALSVVIIVFEGGINLDLHHLKVVSKSIMKLVTLGVFVTFLCGAIAAYYFVAIPWHMALLFGAIVTATGPTVITPLMKQVKVRKRVSTLLEAEGVLNDPISVILAAVVFTAIISPDTLPEHVLFWLGSRVGIGLLTGIICGAITALAIKRTILLTERYANIFTITMALVTFAVAELIISESGIMAVAIAAITIGNSEIPHKESIKEFKGDLSIIALSVIFILLAAMLRFENMVSIGLGGVLTALFLMLIIRPAVIFISTQGSSLTLNEKTFASGIGPRGVVPASMATYFAIKLGKLGMDGGDAIMGLVFITIILTILIQGTQARYLAKKLDVIPMGILIVGAGGVGRLLAERLEKRGEDVTVIDTKEENCQKAIQLGIKAILGDGGDVDILQKAGIEKAKFLVAATDKDDTNLLVCQVSKCRFGLENLVARANNPENLQAFEDLGIRAMSPILSTAVILDDMIERPEIFSLMEIGRGGDIIEVIVSNPKVVGRKLSELKLPKDSLIALIRGEGGCFVPHGDTVIQMGDSVTILGREEAVREVVKLFD
ncbi:MAG: sodium:proton antiporter [Methanocellales archaeon]|nr:sodium:proton antiporter [Methanocellales archaeon]